MTLLSLLLSLWAVGRPAQTTMAANSLTVEIVNIAQAKGTLRLALYNDARRFEKQGESAYQQILPIKKTGALTVTFPDVEAGRYALAVFHDVNNNGELDTNFLGIPTEPYAFSRNPRAKWKAPTFDETVFDFSGREHLQVSLKTWKER